MSASSVIAPVSQRLVLPALTVAAAGLAMVVLATQPTDAMLDYGVGLVPLVVPWLAAVLSVAVAATGLSERGATSAAVSLLMVALVIVTAWSVAMLPFDALRIVGLIPLPLSGWGFLLRLLLLGAGATALVPVLGVRRAGQARCAECRRVLPGRLDRVPRWPAALAVAFALPYPVLRTIWALGGTFGTTGAPLDLDPVVAWGADAAGWVLVAFTVVLLVGRGPAWLRALFGLGGLALGLALTVNGGLAATAAGSMLVTEGPQSSPGAGLPTWTFLLVYGSWFVAGLGIMAASWRYWVHRRDDCPACRRSLQPAQRGDAVSSADAEFARRPGTNRGRHWFDSGHRAGPG